MSIVYFNGEALGVPGAYAAIDATAMGTQTSNESKTIAILGSSKGGHPLLVQENENNDGAVMVFDNIAAATQTLKSGDLLNACVKAWNPVSDSKEGLNLSGANMIICVRTDQSSASSYSYKTTDGTADNVVVKSRDYGSHTNYRIRQTNHSSFALNGGNLLDGTCGFCNLTVTDVSTGAVETFQNIGGVMKVTYTPPTGDTTTTWAGCKIEIQSETGYLEFKGYSGASQQTAAAADPTVDVVINPSVITSMEVLKQEIESIPGWTCTFNNYLNGNIRPQDIDPFKTITTAYSSDSSSGCALTAILADAADTINRQSNLIKIESWYNGNLLSGEYDNTAVFPGVETAMTGGTTGQSPNSWVPFFDALSGFDIDYIVPLTSSATIHAELAAHCSSLSGSIGNERRAIVGGGTNETIDNAISRASALRNARVQLVYGGFYDYNNSGTAVLYPPYILAAALAGRAAGIGDGESMTHDTFRMARPEYTLSRTDIERLLSGGVLAFEQVISRNNTSNATTRLVWDLTTDTLRTDPIHTERAVGALADAINKDIRSRLDKLLIGRKSPVTVVIAAKNEVLSILFDRKNRGDIVDYKNVNVLKNGNTLFVEYNVAPAEPINFVLITAHYYTEPISV